MNRSGTTGWLGGVALLAVVGLAVGLAGDVLAEEIRTVEVEAEVHGAGRTPEEARQEALRRARELAVAEVAGIHIEAQQLRLKSEEAETVRDAFSYLVHTSSQGRIVREEVAFETRVEGGVPIYRARLVADVVLEPGRRDPGFEIEVTTIPQSPTLRNGERLTLVVTPSRDCYVTILDLRSDGSVGRVFPNELEPDHQIPGGRPSHIPRPDAPFEIRVSLDDGRRRDHEQILVVATTEPLTFRPTGDAGDEMVPPPAVSSGLSQLNQWLLRIAADRRTEVLLAYEVVE